MKKRLGFILVALLASPLAATLLPLPVQAATVESAHSLVISTSTPDNAYLAATSIQVNAPLPADLCAIGGTITVTQPIGRDALLAGGTVQLQQPVTGNARIVGGRVTVQSSVGGDLMAAGGFLTVSGKAHDAYIAGNSITMTNGANGDVTIYGVDVSLAGDFAGNVQVVASDKLTIDPNTVINGSLKYDTPQQIDVPKTAVVAGGVNYFGNAPFLPTPKQAKTFATAGLWVFFIVRVAAALVVVGVIAGLFPILTDRVVEATLRRSIERTILLGLLGFATFVAVPVLLVLLAISFAGIGLALLLGAAYLLFLLLSFVYAAAIAGAALTWIVRKRTSITWRSALVGVIILDIIGVVPVLGFVLKVALAAIGGGALLVLFYKFAFRRSDQELLDM